MARGAASKEVVMNKIISTFDGAFKYDKEIRIPMMENGEVIQIKVTLTAAKTNVEPGGENIVPGATKTVAATATPKTELPSEPTEEEKKNVASLIEKLGLN